MAVDAHLQSLNRRHQELEAALAVEMKHPHIDENRTLELKRLKLRLKDQIENLRKHSEPE